MKPFIIIFAGLIGTGKSTLAELLAKKLNIPIISSDILRKELAGISPTEHKYEDFEKGIYSREFTERTYAEMLKRVRDILTKGSSVILDASFQRKSDRKMSLNMADELGIKIFVVETLCKDEEIKKRLNTRIKDKKQASDGRWEIYSRQKEAFEAILAPAHIKQGDEIKEGFHIIIDTAEPVEVCIEKVLKRLQVKYD
ncbi:MAG: nucleoside monophosphate kinase [Nitrospinae bacterium]|nr:nucleoside monophosphate kinase [Nitrospinota bacterium]